MLLLSWFSRVVSGVTTQHFKRGSERAADIQEVSIQRIHADLRKKFHVGHLADITNGDYDDVESYLVDLL